jgi:TonB dependent receptor
MFAYYNINGFYTVSNNVNSGDLIVSDSNYPGYPNYFLGAPYLYSPGAGQGENLRNTAVYFFAQDSYKLKPNLTVNYGLRWELNTPFYDLGNRLQTYRPGQIRTQYPCVLNPNNPANPSAATLASAYGSVDCSENGPASAVFPLGFVFPDDKGVQRGLTQTYYKAFAPRIGIAWSPSWTEGWLGKLSGGPGKSSIRAGFGIFYNPIEAPVMEQYSGEPPFGGSVSLSDTLFNLPFKAQAGGNYPNVFHGVISQTPQTPCSFDSSGPNGCVDWSAFRPMLLFGEFQPHMKSQYSTQYNLTIERQLTKDMILRVGYVGTEAHHLLASYDLNHGDAQTCLDLQNLYNLNNNWVLSGPGGNPVQCTNGNKDLEYCIPPTAVIPVGGLHLPYNGTPGGNQQFCCEWHRARRHTLVLFTELPAVKRERARSTQFQLHSRTLTFGCKAPFCLQPNLGISSSRVCGL